MHWISAEKSTLFKHWHVSSLFTVSEILPVKCYYNFHLADKIIERLLEKESQMLFIQCSTSEAEC